MVTKLVLEYDGTPFAGWAAQPGRRTIASELERALTTVLRRPVDLTVAGRTDRGVHALGQVASVNLTVSIDATTMRRQPSSARIPIGTTDISADGDSPGGPRGSDRRRA